MDPSWAIIAARLGLGSWSEPAPHSQFGIARLFSCTNAIWTKIRMRKQARAFVDRDNARKMVRSNTCARVQALFDESESL